MICQNNIVGKIIRTHDRPKRTHDRPKQTHDRPETDPSRPFRPQVGSLGKISLNPLDFCGWDFWRFEWEFVILRMCIGLCVRSLVGRVRASVQRHINYESVSLQFLEQKIANFLNPRILRQPEAPSLCLYFPSPTASGEAI